MNHIKALVALLAATLMMTLGVVGPQAVPAAADESVDAAAPAAVDIYVTPGYHTVNGRDWHTECEPYSTTVLRCTATIWATQVRYADGTYSEVTGWVFNNLTYFGAPRSHWVNNPLANGGVWVEDGRTWRTVCDTPETGGNGCRTYITTTMPRVLSITPREYGTTTEEVFNNMIRFNAPPPAPVVCNWRNATLPAGFAITAAGLPHSTKPPYAPIDLYNPTSVAGFIRAVTSKIRAGGLTDQQLADQTCLAVVAGQQLIQGSIAEEYNGVTVRWYPYMFEFKANHSDEFEPLTRDGWYSGLAQGSVLGALSELYFLTEDESWMFYGDETFESFMVPLAEGGITNREEGFLWFEEYPTAPEPTTVLNGHLEALIGLDIWWRNRDEQRAKVLFDEAVADLEPFLAQSEVDVEGGLATSYELVRGYPAAPLRFHPEGTDEVQIAQATFNGQATTLPVAIGVNRGPNRIQNPFMNVDPVRGPLVPERWVVIAGATAVDPVRILPREVGSADRAVRIRTSNREWRGIQQVVPAGTFNTGEQLALTFDARLQIDAGRSGIAGKVGVYSRCTVNGEVRTALLYESQRTRSQTWAEYHHTFRAPSSSCDILIQLVSANYSTDSTEVWYDNVYLSTAEPEAESFRPVFTLPDDIKVFRRPITEIGVTGTGSGRLQVYSDGLWQDVTPTVTLTDEVQELVVPERYTGRNIHLAYHENHIDELISMCWRSEKQFFADYARKWKPMAPAHNGTTIVDCPRPAAQARAMGVEVPDLRFYDIKPREDVAEMSLTES